MAGPSIPQLDQRTGPSLLHQGAGLGLRIQPQSGTAPAGQYGCAVIADISSFALVKCTGTDAVCFIQKMTAMSFSLGSSYVVRATMAGNTLTCDLPAQSKSLSFTDGAFPTGAVGVGCYCAEATFDYLKVWKP
jgi:hypothetical protein